MKKIYEDFFKKLDENEINFFKVQMSKVYSQKKELNESYLKRRRVISTDIILNYIYDNNWNIEKKDNSLDLFVLYLESKGLIKDYRKGVSGIINCRFFGRMQCCNFGRLDYTFF